MPVNGCSVIELRDGFSFLIGILSLNALGSLLLSESLLSSFTLLPKTNRLILSEPLNLPILSISDTEKLAIVCATSSGADPGSSCWVLTESNLTVLEMLVPAKEKGKVYGKPADSDSKSSAKATKRLFLSCVIAVILPPKPLYAGALNKYDLSSNRYEPEKLPKDILKNAWSPPAANIDPPLPIADLKFESSGNRFASGCKSKNLLVALSY